MDTLGTRQHFFLDGQPIEYWENPDLPFRCTADDLQHVRDEPASGSLLFNALTLLGSPVAAE